MRKNLKIIIASIFMVACIIGVMNTSNAYSVGADLSSSDKLVGDHEVTVTLSLKDIDANEGIKTITVGNISYDKNVFEEIGQSSFSGINGWSPTYKSNKLVLTNGNSISADGNAVTITFKVKAGITNEVTTIKLENIVASGGLSTSDINVGTKTINIYAIKNSENGNNTNGGTTNKTDTAGGSTSEKTNTTGEVKNSTDIIQTNSNNISSSRNNNKTKNNSTVANVSTLPKAGEAVSAIIKVIVLAITIVGVIYLIKYAKIKK